MSKTVKRLFDQFKPENYVLTLQPDKTQMTFAGQVTITGKKTGRPSQRLTLHQKDLKITKFSLARHDKQGAQDIAIDRVNTHNTFDELRLHSKDMLYPGQYTITIEFSGKITRPMNGMYPCYFTENEQEKMLIATQFESHHAREVFPCIDEPAAKATFDLTLLTPKGETVLANTPIKTQETVKDTLTTTFETTPKMSTYLLAFVYGDMQYQEAKTKNGTLVRTYATPANAAFTDFALDVAVKCLEFYNNYFDIPYPLPKCDLIALPDFASGAMENWGCITFREQCMLVDPANTSLPTKQYVAMVVAHELAHMWFGNLVTMRWWTDLWLNEGFASWIEYLAVDHIFPEWQMWTQFITDEQQVAFKLDSLENTHPIEVPVRHPDEIRTIFDTISYSKGASVIHMLNNYLTGDVFRDGLRHYLKQHAYGNTDTVDLWEALETISHKPVKQFMHAWTSQSGYPIVYGQVDKGTLTCLQERFFLNPAERQKQSKPTLWPVPLLVDKPTKADLQYKTSATYTIADTNGLLLNAGHSGFYRVAYNQEHLGALAKLVEASKLQPLDRFGILGDTFESTKAGYLPTVQALELLSAYAQEDNAAVWEVIAGNIGELRMVMSDGVREAMKPFVQAITKKQRERLGWKAKKDEPYFDSLLRPLILGMAAAADEPGVLAECSKRFTAAKKPEDIEPDLRGVILPTIARHGSQKEFDILLKWHNTSSSSEVRTTLAAAISSFEQPELINKTLEVIISDDVRLQDISYWVAYSFMNRFARDATWQWLTKHWQWLDKNLGNDLSFPRFPIYAARVSSDQKFLKEFTTFFNKVMTPSLERSTKQGIEIIEWHAAWKERDYKDILAFFKTHK